MKVAIRLAVGLLLLVLVAGGCGKDYHRTELRLGITTSLRDSGLMDALQRAFRSRGPGFTLVPIAQGTGAVLEMGRRGDVDVLLVHAPDAERAFLAAGHAKRRIPLFRSEFVIVGPRADPARINGLTDVREALGRIHASPQAEWLSRGDGSGTHLRELALWHEIGIDAAAAADHSAGRGMGAALQVANELGAYTLVDVPTWLRHRTDLDLARLASDPARLANPYSLLLLSRPHRTSNVGLAVVDWSTFLQSEDGRRVVTRYMIGGELPFRPLGRDALARAE